MSANAASRSSRVAYQCCRCQPTPSRRANVSVDSHADADAVRFRRVERLVQIVSDDRCPCGYELASEWRHSSRRRQSGGDSAAALDRPRALGPTEHDARDEAVRGLTSARHSRVADVGRARTRTLARRQLVAAGRCACASADGAGPRTRADGSAPCASASRSRAGSRRWRTRRRRDEPVRFLREVVVRDAGTVQAAQHAQRVDEVRARARRRFVQRHARKVAAAHDVPVEREQARHARLAGEAGQRRCLARREPAREPAQRRRAPFACRARRTSRRPHSRAASCRERRA